jgi:hypothetical protein
MNKVHSEVNVETACSYENAFCDNFKSTNRVITLPILIMFQSDSRRLIKAQSNNNLRNGQEKRYATTGGKS